MATNGIRVQCNLSNILTERLPNLKSSLVKQAARNSIKIHSNVQSSLKRNHLTINADKDSTWFHRHWLCCVQFNAQFTHTNARTVQTLKLKFRTGVLVLCSLVRFIFIRQCTAIVAVAIHLSLPCGRRHLLLSVYRLGQTFKLPLMPLLLLLLLLFYSYCIVPITNM